MVGSVDFVVAKEPNSDMDVLRGCWPFECSIQGHDDHQCSRWDGGFRGIVLLFCRPVFLFNNL